MHCEKNDQKNDSFQKYIGTDVGMIKHNINFKRIKYLNEVVNVLYKLFVIHFCFSNILTFDETVRLDHLKCHSCLIVFPFALHPDACSSSANQREQRKIHDLNHVDRL